jgi:trehalose synthase
MIERVSAAEQHAAELLGGRTVWMVNSTAVGGGVAQLLHTLLPYWRGAGIDVRWMVLRGSAEFFRVTSVFITICKASAMARSSGSTS